MTSQLPAEHWHKMIGEPTHADAIFDRLVHNAYRIELKGESMRKLNAREVNDSKPSHSATTASLRSDGWPLCAGTGVQCEGFTPLGGYIAWKTHSVARCVPLPVPIHARGRSSAETGCET